MHPFSLEKAQVEDVSGGLAERVISDIQLENGGPIYVTMAMNVGEGGVVPILRPKF